MLKLFAGMQNRVYFSASDRHEVKCEVIAQQGKLVVDEERVRMVQRNWIAVGTSVRELCSSLSTEIEECDWKSDSTFEECFHDYLYIISFTCIFGTKQL